MSAQLLPASRMTFSLCSSAGVQGVLVLLFFVGGPIGDSMLDPSPAPAAAAALDEPDIVEAAGTIAGVRLLFRAPEDGGVSNLAAASVVEDLF